MQVLIPKPLVTTKAPKKANTPWLKGRGTRWKVVGDWWVCVDGVWHCVHDGYVFNGSSIPWWLWWLFPPTYDPAWEASAFHDYCYSHLWRFVPKSYADSAFRAIMLHCGAREWIAGVFYKAVSRFGRGGWQATA